MAGEATIHLQQTRQNIWEVQVCAQSNCQHHLPRSTKCVKCKVQVQAMFTAD